MNQEDARQVRMETVMLCALVVVTFLLGMVVVTASSKRMIERAILQHVGSHHIGSK